MEHLSITDLTKFGKLIENILNFDSTGDIYSCIAEFVPQILPADRVTITLYNPEEQGVVIRSIHGEKIKELSEGEKLSAKENYEDYAERVARPSIYCPANRPESTISSKLNEIGVISVLAVPLIPGVEIIGSINIASKTHVYQQSDVFRLEQISSLLATSIAHAEAIRINQAVSVRHRLYAQHLEYLSQLSEKLSAAKSTEQALKLTASCATQLVNATRVSFCELEPDQQNVRTIGLVGITDDCHGQIIPLKDSGLEDCLLHFKKKYSTDLATSESRSQRSLGRSGIKHIWSFPVMGQHPHSRCLNITSPGTDLHPDDAMSMLDTLSRLLGTTLERLFAQWKTEIQAKTDSLTGLFNREEFRSQLATTISVPALSEQDTGIMYFDLDLFKNINDTLGHDTGDNVLQEIAERLKQGLTSHDTLARIGGDEFMVLLTNLSQRLSMQAIAQTLITSISNPIKLRSQELSVGVSIGICRYPRDGNDVDELIKNADIAMYKAKELGRNQYHFFTEDLSSELSQRLQLEKDLSHALKADQFSLVFQPQYNLVSRQVDCVEALLRWEHPTLGFVPPDHFIPIAERCGLIEDVTDWVLEKSLYDLSVLHAQHTQLRMAVNISALEFSPQHNLFSRVIHALEKSAVLPEFLELELTETAFLEHPEHAAKLAQKISNERIRLSIDDFGTGYASLSCLAQLPIDCIKIDKSFVQSVETDSRKQAVVKGIIAISNSLGVDSVGEGIETAGQLNWLKDNGCNCIQGYLFSKPVPMSRLVQTINALNQKNQIAA